MTSSLTTRRQLLARSTALFAALGASSLLQAADWREGQPLPDLAQYGLEGVLPKLKGKVVYLDFWASWCAPCKASFPTLGGWHEQLGAKGFTVLAVSVDEEAGDMKAFLKKNPVPFPVVRDAAQKLVAAANVSGMPTSFIIDRKGIIRHVHQGFKAKDAATLLSQIQALL